MLVDASVDVIVVFLFVAFISKRRGAAKSSDGGGLESIKGAGAGLGLRSLFAGILTFGSSMGT